MGHLKQNQRVFGKSAQNRGELAKFMMAGRIRRLYDG
jgi:hypothetical protein